MKCSVRLIKRQFIFLIKHLPTIHAEYMSKKRETSIGKLHFRVESVRILPYPMLRRMKMTTFIVFSALHFKNVIFTNFLQKSGKYGNIKQNIKRNGNSNFPVHAFSYITYLPANPVLLSLFHFVLSLNGCKHFCLEPFSHQTFRGKEVERNLVH